MEGLRPASEPRRPLMYEFTCYLGSPRVIDHELSDQLAHPSRRAESEWIRIGKAGIRRRGSMFKAFQQLAVRIEVP